MEAATATAKWDSETAAMFSVAARRARRESLDGCACPYCRRRGHYSELTYRPETADNVCLFCGETLIAE